MARECELRPLDTQFAQLPAQVNYSTEQFFVNMSSIEGDQDEVGRGGGKERGRHDLVVEEDV